MKARDHTQAMLSWWKNAGVERIDLAVKRPDGKRPKGKMAWQHDRSLETIPLSWAGWENARCAEIYIRPARYYSWPIVFLDDLPVATAARVVRKYDALVVNTSREGGCHLWLSCSYALDEDQRGRAQRWLFQRIGGDPVSISGEHLGRLAGFRNWKRGGTWVNVLAGTLKSKRWDPRFETAQTAPSAPSLSPSTSTEPDSSPSAKEWGWICGLLEAGCDPKTAYYRLVDRSRRRRGRDAERYARCTIKRAVDHVAHQQFRPRENHEK
jgi:hypothetical protein